MPAASRLAARIAATTRADAHFWADAAATTEALFGNSTTANIFVVGMAVQAGCLPIAPDRMEEAIELNGVAIEANLAAFRWGRVQVADAAAVDVMCSASSVGSDITKADPSNAVAQTSSAVASRLDRITDDEEIKAELRRYASELSLWGGERETEIWLGIIERTHEAEQRVRAGSSTLTRVVAAQLFKLTAYKDEYEVARLMTDEDGLAAARKIAGPDGRIAWKLHPPALRALGMQRKITIGPSARPLIWLLAAGRSLRGSIFDPFGWAEVRRVERKLAATYREAICEVIEALAERSFDAAVELARLPDEVRGYEDLKLERAAAYQSKLEAARRDFAAH
jgi:indolepyruvate ferredoxin oxidoreductase